MFLFLKICRLFVKPNNVLLLPILWTWKCVWVHVTHSRWNGWSYLNEIWYADRSSTGSTRNLNSSQGTLGNRVTFQNSCACVPPVPSVRTSSIACPVWSQVCPTDAVRTSDVCVCPACTIAKQSSRRPSLSSGGRVSSRTAGTSCASIAAGYRVR